MLIHSHNRVPVGWRGIRGIDCNGELCLSLAVLMAIGWSGIGVVSWWLFAARMVLLIDIRYGRLLLSHVNRPRIPLRRPIGLLPDLCMIIECAMYTVCRFRFRFSFMATLYHTIF